MKVVIDVIDKVTALRKGHPPKRHKYQDMADERQRKGYVIGPSAERLCPSARDTLSIAACIYIIRRSPFNKRCSNKLKSNTRGVVETKRSVEMSLQSVFHVI